MVKIGGNMKKLSFGFMRLPQNSDDAKDINYDEICEMVDYAMDRGFNFFDSAYDYHEGFSDIAIKKCIVDRYPRNDFLIANKMPVYNFTPKTDMEAIFKEQLSRCGVDYFDYYMLHCLNDEFYEGVMKDLDCWSYVKELKEKGLIKKIGISHHDSAKVLDKILTEHPEVEFALIQINYLDWINNSIQSSKCYKVAKKHGVEILAMEPLKGGTLVNIPPEAEEKFIEYNPNLSIASWGIRFAASLEGVSTVFSGMSNFEQLKDNASYMEDFKPLDREEKKVINKTRKIIEKSIPIACTYCDYCLKECPENIPISKFFSLYNDAKTAIEIQDLYYVYYGNYSKESAPASACTECGNCEDICTQHLSVIDYLKDVKNLFEKDSE